MFEPPAFPAWENSSAVLPKNIFIFSGCSQKNCTLSGNGKPLLADTSRLIFYKALSALSWALQGYFVVLAGPLSFFWEMFRAYAVDFTNWQAV